MRRLAIMLLAATALAAAGAAQAHGVRTLVVDLDPQANATVALDAGETSASIADVLAQPTRRRAGAA